MLGSLHRTGWRHTDPLRANTVQLWKAAFILQKGHLELYVAIEQMTRVEPTYIWHGPQPAPRLEGASWADMDQQGRLVYARDGKLYAFAEGAEVEIADLNLDQPPRRTSTLRQDDT